MTRNYTAFIEWDKESGTYIGRVPSITGAHTFAESFDDLHVKLKEVVALCLEVMDAEDIESIPSFAGISQIEVAI
ncbi:MAG: type II toxin-antitoxin system HicB family antitoxin [Defluviitaleaceae bacterium]|nr:type II toxin-antitoxin system HicB family antitoxin [Defluviitaleaceae bacterium]